VDVDLARDGDVYDLTVTDMGPGIPQADIARLFKPFSVSADGSGFGLGLSIAQRAIAVNGGRISIRNREEGGLEIRVGIPAATLEL
jgi:C4-dicarboxylate-specific signal transduction histidine kinase